MVIKGLYRFAHLHIYSRSAFDNVNA